MEWKIMYRGLEERSHGIYVGQVWDEIEQNKVWNYGYWKVNTISKHFSKRYSKTYENF